MTSRSDLDTKALRALAEAATSGPWKVGQMGRRHDVMGPNGKTTITEMAKWNDAAFIAAANPTTVLALLDEVEESRVSLSQSAQYHKRVCGRVEAERDDLRQQLAAAQAEVDELRRKLNDR